MMDSGPSAMPHVNAGKLKVLGTTSVKRASAFPTVSTFSEQGLKGFDVVAWNGMVVPAGTPAPIVAALNASIRKACNDPQVIESMNAMGLEVANGTPAEFGNFLRTEIRKWGKAVAQAGVQID